MMFAMLSLSTKINLMSLCLSIQNLKTLPDFRSITTKQKLCAWVQLNFRMQGFIYSLFPLQWSDGPVKVLGIAFCSSWQQTIDDNFNNVAKRVGSIEA